MKTRDDWRQAWLVVQTSLLLPAYERVFTLDEMLARLAKPHSDEASRFGAQRDFATRFPHTLAISDWFLGLGRGVFQPTCLKRSLVLFRLLRRQAIPVVLHMGVRSIEAPQGRKLDGHAWLTLHNQPLLVDHDGQFTETYRYPR